MTADEIKRSKQSKCYAIGKAFIIAYKTSKPCADCRQFYPAVCMDFDHLRDKSYDIAHMRHSSVERIQREIDKCEVVCSNCHRLRTARRRAGL